MNEYNILFTYITPFHPERGGIGRVTDTLCREFLRRGYKVFYLIYNSAITIKHEFDYPVPLEYFPSSELLSAENVEFYQKFLIDKKIDFVINQSGNFSDTALYVQKGNSKAKLISVLHSEPWVAYKHLWDEVIPLRSECVLERLKQVARILLYPYIKYKYRKNRLKQISATVAESDKICVLCDEHMHDVLKMTHCSADSCVVIPNPNSYCSSELYNPCSVGRSKTILFVGLLVKNKRVDRLIRVWKNLAEDYPDWSLVLLGDGDLKYVAYLKFLAANVRNVTFAGFSNPREWYKSASIFAFPTNYEGWPMVLTEAMQHGVVPVLFDSFAAARVIVKHDKNGLLVSPFDLSKYESSLRSLMDNTEKLQKMSHAAVQSVCVFDVKYVGDMWEKVFRSLV